MRYFKQTTGYETRIWISRKDGMERCIYHSDKSFNNFYSEWFDPHIRGESTCEELLSKYKPHWSEITEEQAFLEMV